MDELIVTAVVTNQVQILSHALELHNVVLDMVVLWAPPGHIPRRRTLLMVAARSGSVEVAQLLLCRGADPNQRSQDDGLTALHCAAESGHARTAEVITLLLSFGAIRDMPDLSGRTAVELLADLIGLQNTAKQSARVEMDQQEIAQGPSELDKAEFQTDEFRMFGFKIIECANRRPHDWTECPFAHPGEKARRRDLQKFTYSGNACQNFRKGTCKQGDSCPFAHGVFEVWLHPSRYRTQLCKDLPICNRRLCFFAHSLQELRQPTGNASSGDGDSCSDAENQAVSSGSGSGTVSPRSFPSQAADVKQKQPDSVAAAATTSNHASSSAKEDDASTKAAFAIASALQYVQYRNGCGSTDCTSPVAGDLRESTSADSTGFRLETMTAERSAADIAEQMESCLQAGNGSDGPFDSSSAHWMKALSDDADQANNWPVGRSVALEAARINSQF